MRVPRYNMMTLLFEIVNSPYSKPVDYELAKFFLLQRERVCHLSIYDVEEECFVSRSTIRRFCEKLGFANFSMFKEELEIPYDAKEFEEETKQEPYIQKHIKKIHDLLDEIEYSDEIHSQCKTLAHDMHTYQNIIFIVSNSSVSFVKDFQQQLLFQNCFITIISSDPIERLKTMTKIDSTMIVVISYSGTYVDMIYESLRDLRCPKYLITSKEFTKQNIFDNIIYMTKQRKPEETEVVLIRKYASSLLFDIIYYYYVKLSETEKQNI